MALSRQFHKSRIVQLMDNVWELVVVFSYYNLYVFEERSIHKSLEHAKDHLIRLRCPDFIAIDKDAHVITLQT